MSPSSLQHDTPEEFVATVKYRDKTERFEANKVNILKSVDKYGVECWTLMGFHDTQDKNTGRALANGIHLYIKRAPQKGSHTLVRALTLPDFKKNSARYIKYLDDIPDEKNELDTLEEFIGREGRIAYEWDAGKKSIIGTFTFKAIDFDDLPFQVEGHFKLFNPGGE